MSLSGENLCAEMDRNDIWDAGYRAGVKQTKHEIIRREINYWLLKWATYPEEQTSKIPQEVSALIIKLRVFDLAEDLVEVKND